MATPHSNQPRRALLLTGASRGIGHATVKRFSAAGWRVITCSRHPFPENCPWEMGPEDHIQVDLADPDRTLRAIAEIKQRLENGELHALVNNAAISPKAEGSKRLSSIDTGLDVWEHVFRVNFLAPIMLARGLIKELKAAQGAVVNVTSIAGSRVHPFARSEEHTSELQSRSDLVCRLLLEKKKYLSYISIASHVAALASGVLQWSSMCNPSRTQRTHISPCYGAPLRSCPAAQVSSTKPSTR